MLILKVGIDVVDNLSRSYKNPCGCEVSGWQYPVGCIKNIMNSEAANKLSWVAMIVLRDAPPSVPSRGEPLVASPLLESWERNFLRCTHGRHKEKWVRSEEWHEESDEREGYDEDDEEESPEEESSEQVLRVIHIT